MLARRSSHPGARGLLRRSVADGANGDALQNVKSELSLNLITGRILKTHDSWSFAPQTPPGAAALYTARRFAYSAALNASDVAADVAKAVEDATSPKVDEQIFKDPSGDPLKFFQQQDTTMTDAFQLALVLASLWLVAKVIMLTSQ